MTNKAQVLDARNIMQGLEEFAHFMSFQANNSSNLRIISVQSVEQDAALLETDAISADILHIQRHLNHSVARA